MPRYTLKTGSTALALALLCLLAAAGSGAAARRNLAASAGGLAPDHRRSLRQSNDSAWRALRLRSGSRPTVVSPGIAPGGMPTRPLTRPAHADPSNGSSATSANGGPLKSAPQLKHGASPPSCPLPQPRFHSAPAPVPPSRPSCRRLLLRRGIALCGPAPTWVPGVPRQRLLPGRLERQRRGGSLPRPDHHCREDGDEVGD